MTTGTIRRSSTIRVALLGLTVAATLLPSAGGCGRRGRRNRERPMQTVSDNDAARMQQKRDEWESRQKEPAITADTRFAAGQLAESQGDLPRALEQYNQALKLNDKHVDSLYRLGVLYAKVRQHPQAVDAWKRYVRATHESAVGYSNLGFCHELAGDLDEAEQAYLRGIERDSESAPCRVNYGLMLARHGRVAEATVQLQYALQPAEVHYNLASVFEGQGRPEQARAEYRKALELDPKLQDAQTRLDLME